MYTNVGKTYCFFSWINSEKKNDRMEFSKYICDVEMHGIDNHNNWCELRGILLQSGVIDHAGVC